MKWYKKICDADTANSQDLSVALEAAEYYSDLYYTVNDEVKPPRGTRIESIAHRIPGIVEERYLQLYELESIIEHCERRLKKARAEQLRQYLEHYPRSLQQSVAKDYAEATPEVQEILIVLQQVGAVRNQYAGLHKAIEYLHFQVTNIVKLREAGLEDATF